MGEPGLATAEKSPERIHALGFVDEFVRQHKDQPDCPFLFILGAGASKSSGIKTGGEFVDDWLHRLHERSMDREVPFDLWLRENRAGIANFSPADPAAAYPYVYERLFGGRAQAGFSYLEKEMRGARPGYGYAVLAQILATTQHNVVLTTNFDNLVADALLLSSDTYPLVCGHESLARFAGARQRRPVVIKLHRDLLLEPKNTSQELEELAASLRTTATDLLRTYTPIVIGYGGNDGSLMGLLEAIEPGAFKNGIYWCYRESDSLPRQRILGFLSKHRGALVPISDFDGLLFLLGERLSCQEPLGIIQRKAEEHQKSLRESRIELEAKANQGYFSSAAREEVEESRTLRLESSESKPTVNEQLPGDGAAELAVLAATTAPDGKTWWQWVSEAKAERDLDRRDAIYRKAVTELPTDAKLLGIAASFFHGTGRDPDFAESLYERALKIDPKDAVNLGNFARFQLLVRANLNYAQKLWERAIIADPRDEMNLSNYALFLQDYRQDYNRAQELYERALHTSPRQANNLGNYANFLAFIRQDYDRAQDLYERALDLDPRSANKLCNYATFLAQVRQAHDRAQGLYEMALEADPRDVNVVSSYAGFLLSRGEKQKGEALLKRALNLLDPRNRGAIDVETWFQAFALGGPAGSEEALRSLRELLMDLGARSPHWDFSASISRAAADHHPDSDWLPRLAAVINGKQDPSTLDAWPAWKEAERGRG